MDARAKKLRIKYKITSDQAKALVAAGYTLPKQIKAAKQADLEKVAGVGEVAAGRLKGR